MNLYLISQSKNNDYDTYDSAVVAAETEAEARNIHPDGYSSVTAEEFSSWVSHPDEVTSKLIGEATEGTRTGVICASFNAG